MRPRLFTIDRDGPGTLSTMARPRGGRGLGRRIGRLARADVSVLVSLLSDAETTRGLTDEGDEARAAGITFYRLPTPDRHPPDRAAALQLADRLRDHLGRGESVVLHCWAGIGRCSTMAATVLLAEGLDPEAAWARISAARGHRVPDNDTQRAFIRQLADDGLAVTPPPPAPGI